MPTISNKKKNLPKRAYIPWTSYEDAILLKMYECKMKKSRIACFFERTTGAITSRIEKLLEE